MSRGDQPAGRLVVGRPGLAVVAAGGSFGLGLSRLLAEAYPLAFAWLATWPGTILVTSAMSAAGLALWWRVTASGRPSAPTGDRPGGRWHGSAALVPLFLSLGYVLSAREQAALLPGLVWLLGGIWLVAIWLAARQSRAGSWLLIPIVLVIYLATLGRSVGRADTFEFQVVAHQLGIAHPTGYPLYLLLGKLFTLLPLGSVAWRVNLLSAVCAVGAAVLVHLTLRRLLARLGLTDRVAGALAAVGGLVFGFSPTLWSQAVEAEVYALNSLFVAWMLWRLVDLLEPHASVPPNWHIGFALALGLGLSNHLTTVLLIPPLALALLLVGPGRLGRGRPWWRLALPAGLFLLAGLMVYLYLPLRWPAVNDGAHMTLSQFVDWVVGGRFKGALQLGAWRTDPTRYAILGRLVLDQWGWPGVALAAIGLVGLAWRRWRQALVTGVAWLGYAFYALIYYVPDISVFLIPAHLVMALWIGYGAGTLAALATRLTRQLPDRDSLVGVVAVALFALVPGRSLILHWAAVDRSGPEPLEAWGRFVLGLELDSGAAILADSVRIAPLYYLQQTEGLRPDLDIVVLPDEAAYRAELDRRVAAGQTVYLARFLPGLEGVYHLRSAGPLLEVSRVPLTQVPRLDRTLGARLGTAVTLLGCTDDGWLAAYPDPFYVTLYWTAESPLDGVYLVRLRLVGSDGRVWWLSEGGHPAGNYYPTYAWQPGEIIPDAHQIPLDIGLAPGAYDLQVALLMPFSDSGLTPSGQTTPWLSLGTMTVLAPRQLPQPDRPVRIWLDDAVITGLKTADNARPGADLPVTLWVAGAGQEPVLSVGWEGETGAMVALESPITTLTVPTLDQTGRSTLTVAGDRPMRCGWLGPLAQACSLISVTMRGAQLPAGAVNYDDQIGLLVVDVPERTIRPGATLDVTLTWQALTPIGEDYTVFVHLLDQHDRIVGQVDSWPVQGTWPTSQWRVGEPVVDRYTVALDPAATTGPAQLEIGLYLLGTMRRLPALNLAGDAIDDRLLLDGFVITGQP